MEYKEKVQLAEELHEMIKSGSEITELKSHLSSKGLKSYDITEVIFSAKKMLNDEFQIPLKSLLLKEDISGIDELLDGVDIEFQSEMKAKAIESIKANSKKAIKKQVLDKVSSEEIVSSQQNKFISSADIQEHIDFIKKYNESPDTSKKIGLLALGIPSVVLGIGIAFFFFMKTGEFYRFTLFLFGFGIWNIYKAFTPPGVVEMSSRD